ncbi:DUF397 domain-containing protein [Saccharopolyspora sp. ASAGF58]|uniref:DUF397 domain-containing protein n=1 Tax=Saccharopolyspora sp. ASAGF58 TaxID=2719023 RepID=UPI00143FE271|nr:DUF397 domain-containing protein [Saccharopolyspora sp. ASAGF58]QIZ35257.1 DUF397 domain-containing protein [Saccharopolyspora sp. ASAGF58]
MSDLGDNLANAHWFKSSYSTSSQGCVEVALALPAVGVRDSKDPNGGTLVFTAHRWINFIASAKK